MILKDKICFAIPILLIVILTIIRIFSLPLIGIDGFTNYYNTLKIYNGEIMWEDVNIITTPFLFLIGIMVFKIFGTKYFVYKALNCILNLLLFGIFYKTFRNLNINKKSSLIYSIILYWITLFYITIWELTYNFICLIICLIGVNVNLNREKVKYFNFWQGLIIFLLFFTKQNIGLYYAISQIVIEIITGEKNKKITNLIKQFIVVFIGGLFFLIYLLKANLLYSFIDMTILGMANFSSNHIIIWLPFLITIILELFVILTIFQKKYDLNKRKRIIILAIIGTMQLFIMYPIADIWHTILASVVLYITVIYIINLDLENNRILLCTNILLGLFCACILIADILCFENKIYEINYDKNSVFYMTIIRKPNKIKNISNFIKLNNGKVVVIHPEAGIYNLYNNLESHSFFDGPFNGNIGSNQMDKMINKLSEYEDYYILINGKENYFQEIVEFRNYIEENYIKYGEIEDFSIYRK